MTYDKKRVPNALFYRGTLALFGTLVLIAVSDCLELAARSQILIDVRGRGDFRIKI